MTNASPELKIQELLQQLDSKDGMRRQEARHRLVAFGSSATGGLLGALRHQDSRVRWEAAKALEEIKDPRAAPGLVDALEDSDRDVRWVAAVALIALDGGGLVSLLDALGRKPESPRLRERAAHVLGALRPGHGDVVRPLLEALEHSPIEALPAAAKAAYERLRQERGGASSS
jgi:HEAT repeat protein